MMPSSCSPAALRARIEPGRIGVGAHQNQGCQGYGSDQTRTQSQRRTRYASAEKTTQHCGGILWHTYLRVCKSMRLYLRLA